MKSTMENKMEITQTEYNLYLEDKARYEKDVEAAQEELRIVSQDGTDDENPAYGYALMKVEYAVKRLSALVRQYANCKIVKEKGVESHQFGEHCKSITVRCTYAEDDVEEQTLTVGHSGLGSISLQSPLYLFLKGKEVGYSGIFTNKMKDGEFSYHVEILDIEF